MYFSESGDKERLDARVPELRNCFRGTMGREGVSNDLDSVDTVDVYVWYVICYITKVALCR